MLAVLALVGALIIAAGVARREIGETLWLRLTVVAGAATLSSFAALGDIDAALFLGAIAAICVVTATIDARKLLIPDALVLTLGVLTCLAPFRPPPVEQVIGGILLGALFVAVRTLHQWARGAEGLGLGDVKFAIVAGAMLGAQGGLAMTAAAASVTAVWVFWRVRRPAHATGGEVLSVEAPFGVALAGTLFIGCFVRAMTA